MSDNKPVIVGFVADLMFTTRIENVARKAGFQMQWIETAVAVGQTNADESRERPGESLHGAEGNLFTKITAWQPALLLFDLDNDAIPWRRWIPRLKSSPATRRLPIMCFGSHKNVDSMKEAKRVGADVVLARSRFTADMPSLFQKHARIPDHHALHDTCQESLADLGHSGIELFNRGEYYKCHDDLEEAWMNDKSPGRNLYRGILQVGIALYQIQRDNYRGAVKMLLRVRQWLDPLPATCRGVNIAALRQNVQEIHDAVAELGPDRLEQFDWSMVQPITYNS